jgi:hypothetical protein
MDSNNDSIMCFIYKRILIFLNYSLELVFINQMHLNSRN